MAFQKGQSGNPGGRPSEARQELQALLDARFTKIKRAKVIDKLIEDAIAGQHDARVLLLAYTYGKPTEHKEITGADGGPIPLEIARIDYRNGLAETEAGPASDSDASGED